MNKKKESMILIASAAPASKTLVIKNQQSNKSRKRQKTQQRQNVRFGIPNSVGPNGKQQAVLQQYIDTLKNPFDNGPVKLGWGCMTNTELATCYARGVATAGVGGHVSVQMYPCIGNSVTYSWSFSTSLSSTNWNVNETSITPSNQGALVQTFREVRIVSGGIKVKSLAPLTSAEPYIYGGYNNGGPIGDVRLNTLDTLWSGVNASINYSDARNGVQIVTRPLDVESYVFKSSLIAQPGEAFLEHPWISVVTPSGTSIAYEVVLNLECLSTNTTGLGVPTVDSVPFTDTVASLFASTEHLMASISTYLGPALTACKMASSASKLAGYRHPNVGNILGGGYEKI